MLLKSCCSFTLPVPKWPAIVPIGAIRATARETHEPILGRERQAWRRGDRHSQTDDGLIREIADAVAIQVRGISAAGDVNVTLFRPLISDADANVGLYREPEAGEVIQHIHHRRRTSARCRRPRRRCGSPRPVEPIVACNPFQPRPGSHRRSPNQQHPGMLVRPGTRVAIRGELVSARPGDRTDVLISMRFTPAPPLT